jgi:hypothetical protein
LKKKLITLNTDIKLQKLGESEFNSLPRGIKLVVIGNKPVFVRRIGGRFMPVSPTQQEELEKKHVFN